MKGLLTVTAGDIDSRISETDTKLQDLVADIPESKQQLKQIAVQLYRTLAKKDRFLNLSFLAFPFLLISFLNDFLKQ